MEKVLRSFPSVGRVFVLLRPSRKSGRSAPRRLEEEIAASVCFSRLREMWPAFSERLVPIAGDIGKPLLGMSEEDAALMRDSVSLVFHCAATVKLLPSQIPQSAVPLSSLRLPNCPGHTSGYQEVFDGWATENR
jgi:fatty acyl-CoA reductase